MSSLLSQEEIDQKKLADKLTDTLKAIQLLKRLKKEDAQLVNLIDPVLNILKTQKKRILKQIKEYTDNLVASVDAFNEAFAEANWNY